MNSENEAAQAAKNVFKVFPVIVNVVHLTFVVVHREIFDKMFLQIAPCTVQ